MCNFSKILLNSNKRLEHQSRILRIILANWPPLLKRLEAQRFEKLSSQTFVNLRENASAISLRSGKQLDEASRPPKNVEKPKDEPIQGNRQNREKDEATYPQEASATPKVKFKNPISTYNPPLPFLSKFANSRKEKHEQEILDTFHKVQINIPLLDAINQVPHYESSKIMR